MKQKLRSTKLLERLNHHPDQKGQKDLLIIQKISSLPEFKKADTIVFYLPIHGEVDLVELFEEFKLQKKFVLPRVNGEKLQLHPIKSLQETEIGSFQIPEPKKDLPTIAPAEVDLILVAGLVFGKNGHRIGYGKGFYDRLLKTTNCVKIGIAYHFQIVENIEGEGHDVPMDMIVTENELIRVGETA